MRRTTCLIIAAGALLAGCATVPEGAVEAQALECPPGEEGCDDIRPLGEGGEFEIGAGNFYFDVRDGISVTGDDIEVTMINEEEGYHNVEFLGAADGSEFLGGSDGEAVVGAEGNETGTGTVALFPGEWTIICNVPGHRAAGMEATVNVFATPEEAEAAEQEATEGDAGMGG